MGERAGCRDGREGVGHGQRVDQHRREARSALPRPARGMWLDGRAVAFVGGAYGECVDSPAPIRLSPGAVGWLQTDISA